MRRLATEDVFGRDQPKTILCTEQTLWDNPAPASPSYEFTALDLGAYEATEKPVEKSRKEVQEDAIDRRSILSVAEIRAKFSKGSKPIFPKQLLSASERQSTGRLASTPSSVTSSQRTSSSPTPEASDINTSDKTLSPSEPVSSIVTPRSLQSSSNSVTIPGVVNVSEHITTEEFLALAKSYKCEHSISLFTAPTIVNILIIPEQPLFSPEIQRQREPQIVLKKMHLQFNLDQRLLMMLRQGTLRYIRLNDVFKIDASDKCLDFLAPYAPELHPEFTHPMALYFTTTSNPMVMLFSNVLQKESLFQLLILLRQLVKAATDFEVIP